MWLQTKGNSLEQFRFIFAKENFLSPSQAPFFLYLFIPYECDPLHTVCPFPPGLFTLRVNRVVLISGCFDADGGCAVEGAHGLMRSKCSEVTKRCLLHLTGDEALWLRRSEAWLMGVVLVD